MITLMVTLASKPDAHFCGILEHIITIHLIFYISTENLEQMKFIFVHCFKLHDLLLQF